MSYWILPASGIPVSRTTVRRVTQLESFTDANKERSNDYGQAIKQRFKEIYTTEAFPPQGSNKPTLELWAELAEEDEDFQTEFNRVFDNPEVKEADEDFTPDTFDNYLHMELSIDCDGERRLTSTASERPEQSKQPSK
jgi:hypothetical protein